MIKTFLEVMLQSAHFLQGIIPPSEIKATLTEFRNKLHAFYLFQHVDSVLHLSGANLTLTQMVERASTLGPFFSVWAVEGLGHYYTRLHTSGGKPPRELLRGNHARDLPRHSLVPLHAGMGLALAESCLGRQHHAKDLADDFLELCLSNSCDEYTGTAIESLGLVARNLYPELITRLDQELAQRSEELLAYFWHGVGRGIYFTPTNLLPLWGYEMCLREPPHHLGKLNAAAGYAWALTLVNLRQPEVVAAFLKQQETRLRANDAFANGVCSALVIWLDSSPQDDSVALFCNYHPEWLDPSLPHLWDRYVRQSGDEALRLYRSRAHHIGSLFRYQPTQNPVPV